MHEGRIACRQKSIYTTTTPIEAAGTLERLSGEKLITLQEPALAYTQKNDTIRPGKQMLMYLMPFFNETKLGNQTDDSVIQRNVL